MKNKGIYTGLPQVKGNPFLKKKQLSKAENAIILGGAAGEGMSFYHRKILMEQMLKNKAE